MYALLDSQSDTSFILDKSLNSFQVESTEVELSVSTMTGLNQTVKSRKVIGFEVRGHNLTEKVQLPTLYSRSQIPHNRNHFPNATFCREFPHLDSVSSKLHSFGNIEVGLLIGFNCSKALCPLEVVQGPTSSSPFAVRTPLGWSVVGSQSSPDQKEVVSNHIVCSEEPSTKPAVSVQEKEIRDVVYIPHQNVKVEEERQRIEVNDVCQKSHDVDYKAPMPFEKDTILELECKFDLAEKNLQFMKEHQELEFENCANLSDVEANFSLVWIVTMSFVICFSSMIAFAVVE